MPHASTRPVAGDHESWDRSPDEFIALADAVGTRRATAEQAAAYGRHLFDGLFGPTGWAALDTGGDGAKVVYLAWPEGELHRLSWELLHDGAEYLALRQKSPVVFVRLVGPPGEPAPKPVDGAPRVLFAVGSGFGSNKVRAGSEVMGVLRDVERGSRTGASAIRAHVLAEASLAGLRIRCERLEPDVVHLVGHGRWDPAAGVGRLTLRRDGGGDGDEEEHSAAELADALGSPSLVVLSACDGAFASTESGLPLAAELAAAGIPIVIAMAGAISDTACRVFTRSVVASLSLGIPFTTALAKGRRAAFAYARSTPVQADWALPSVFSRAVLDPGFALADPTAVSEVQATILRHEHVEPPIWAGRHELLDDLEALQAPDGPSVLLLWSSGRRGVGGSRALLELAAQCIRLGHVPVRVGPFVGHNDKLSDLRSLAAEIVTAMRVVAGNEVVRFDPAMREPLEHGGPSMTDDEIVQGLRADLLDLRNAVAEQRPGVFDAAKPPVLLLDDVHLCVDGMRSLLAKLKAGGLGVGPSKLPVVLFVRADSRDGLDPAELRGKIATRAGWLVRELVHISEMEEDGRDRWAYLAWMLNPTKLESWPQKVLAPAVDDRDPDGWLILIRLMFGDAEDFYDYRAHAKFAKGALRLKMVTECDDDAVLRAYGMLL